MKGISLRTVAIIAVIVLIGVFYFLFNPTDYVWMPKCMLKQLTGLECPGCGSQRFIHAMLHGNIAAAWRVNPYLMVMFPYMLILLCGNLSKEYGPKLNRTVGSVPAIIAFAVITAAWTIYRNVI
ncbi:MAG: DUF2752 domain-containing protein [Clostridium sp.]|nr:DUF2752 domain-containing protein [Prevotella sp.]MCM1428558.1 DUF2752 domain-containing protein [Clostridium sp.]MCM1475023.1 DUF2752 domain-containing protein [Muribaculaceae bacterium]